MVAADVTDRIVQLRRDLHRHPEVGWCEFYTTDRIVKAIEDVGVDELVIGPDLLTEDRFLPPESEAVDHARDRAREAGVDESMLETLGDGYTGAMGVVRNGNGPTIGVRVDIDGLPQTESDDADHFPVTEGFRSRYDDRMHACGHDAHAAIGVGVLAAITETEFDGTLKVFFQPAEELGAGAASIVGSGHLADVDALLAVHVGLDRETGTVIPGIESFLAINGFSASFEGAPSHAGDAPNEGANAVQAMATAVQNLYAIPRHADGKTRINAGEVGGGTATNVVPESAFIEGEIRGETTALREYMETQVDDVVTNAARVHGCAVDLEFLDGAPSAECDDVLVDAVVDAARANGATPVSDAENALGGSEDATRMMRSVQRNGGVATYLGVGASNPTGHHTATFDVDEDAIPLAVDVLVDAVRSTADSIGR